MKKMFLILSVLVFFTSCVGYKVTSDFVNYSLYEKKGFFITEAPSVSFDYVPVGSITVTVLSGVDRKSQLDGMEPGVLGNFKNSNLLDGFDYLYKEAMDRSANGVINVRYYRIKEGWVITGMLIKK